MYCYCLTSCVRDSVATTRVKRARILEPLIIPNYYLEIGQIVATLIRFICLTRFETISRYPDFQSSFLGRFNPNTSIRWRSPMSYSSAGRFDDGVYRYSAHLMNFILSRMWISPRAWCARTTHERRFCGEWPILKHQGLNCAIARHEYFIFLDSWIVYSQGTHLRLYSRWVVKLFSWSSWIQKFGLF